MMGFALIVLYAIDRSVCDLDFWRKLCCECDVFFFFFFLFLLSFLFLLLQSVMTESEWYSSRYL